MKWTNHPRIFLEVALVKLCNEQRPNQMEIGQIQQLLQKIEDLEIKLQKSEKRHLGGCGRKACRTGEITAGY